MQPDDIIRQKSWQQLTNTEKELLQSLVTTEQEYDLLRNIMLVSLQEMETIPVIDPRVGELLQKQLPKGPDRNRVIQFGYYAAASILIVILATWLIVRNTQDKTGTVAVIPPAQKPIITNTKKEPGAAIRPAITSIQRDSEKKTVSRKLPVQKKTQPEINTCIASDTMMLALVTEVY
jgi:hypothetical protein